MSDDADITLISSGGQFPTHRIRLPCQEETQTICLTGAQLFDLYEKLSLYMTRPTDPRHFPGG